MSIPSLRAVSCRETVPSRNKNVPDRALTFGVDSPDARLQPEPRALFGRYFRSEKTGLWLYRRRWMPAGSVKPSGIAFIVHGCGPPHGDCCIAHVTVEMDGIYHCVTGNAGRW